MGSTVKTEKTTAKRTVGIILNVIMWIFLVFAFTMMIFAFASISNDYGVPVMGDKVILSVKSESMEPTIKKGDLIVGKVLSLDEKNALQENDIITFFVDLDGDGVKDINTHRIVEVKTSGEKHFFRTKGDNLALYEEGITDDGIDVAVDDIICQWKEGDTQIAGLGAFLGFLQSRTGFLLIVVLPLVILFVYEIIRFILMILKLKPRKAQAISEAEKEEIRRQAVEEYRRSLNNDSTEEVEEEVIETEENKGSEE